MTIYLVFGIFYVMIVLIIHFKKLLIGLIAYILLENYRYYIYIDTKIFLID